MLLHRAAAWTHHLGAAVPAGVLEAGLPLLVGSVPEAGVFDLKGSESQMKGRRKRSREQAPGSRTFLPPPCLPGAVEPGIHLPPPNQ